ncbi:MAG: MG2 domain-containing protein [Firmicutes bacterium]|nr:MG2 domain-containing protein [Bacillota bacterium]
MGTRKRMACVSQAIVLTALLAVLMVPMAASARQAQAWVFATARNYLPGDEPELGVRGQGVSSLWLDIYRFDGCTHFKNGDWSTLWNVDYRNVPGREKVRSVRVPIANRGGKIDAAVTLKPLPPGQYVAVTRSAQLRVQNTAWFSVSELGLISKQSAAGLAIYAINLRTGEPMPDVTVHVELSSMRGDVNLERTDESGNAEHGAPVLSGASGVGASLVTVPGEAHGVTDSRGLFTIRLGSAADFAFVVASRGDDFAVLGSSYWWDARLRKVYIYTDRPVYRPNNAVCFKGIARGINDSGYEVMARRPVKIEISDSRSNVIYKQDLLTNDWGSFSGEFKLGAEPPLGTYWICAIVDGERHEGNFQVAEYRKPEWTVEVEFDRDMYIAGDRLDATCKAAYYFDAPVRNARVAYRVYRQRTGFFGVAGDENIGEYGAGADEMFGLYYGEFVLSGETQTDKNGEARISFDSSVADGHNYRYIVEADVIDATNRKAYGRGYAEVARGTFDVDVSTGRYVVGEGDTFKVVVRAVDLDGKGVAREIEVAMLKRTYSEKGYADTPVHLAGISTLASGEGSLELKAQEPGDYVIQAKAVDERGNSIVAETHIWTTAAAGSWADMFRTDLGIVCDQSRYEVGDVAKVLITAPSDVHAVLLTVEDREVRDLHVVKLENGSATVDLAVKPEYAPNTYVCVTAVVSGVMQTATRQIVVPAPARVLNVEIMPNKESYRPGETATYLIVTKNSEGDGVPAEVSFGLVDESIYAVKSDTTPSIDKFFHGRRERTVSTENSFPITYYGGADKEGGAEATRKYFPDTAAWFPSVVTDANGHAVVQVKMPDSLTTWRATVRAHTLSTVVGQAQGKVTVSKPLSIRLGIPRHYTMGDCATVVGVIHNETRWQRTVFVNLKARGATIAGRSWQWVKVPAGGEAMVVWDVEPEFVGDVVFTANAWSWFVGDKLELSVPVLPFGEKFEEVWAGEVRPDEIEGAGGVKFELPENAIEGATLVAVDISPGYAGVVESALEFLVNYPYGCVEQTMSAFLPDVLAHRAFARMGMSMPRTEEELAKMVNSGLARLYKFQHWDGGYGWWEHDDSSLWMTSYVLYGLERAKRSGFHVSEEVMANAARYLSEAVADEKNDTDRAFACYVLAEQGALGSKGMKALEKLAAHFPAHPDTQSEREGVTEPVPQQPLTVAYVSLAGSAAGRDDIGLAGARLLEKMATRASGQAYWKTEDKVNRWRDETGETTAWVMMALLEAEPSSPLLPQAARHLALTRDGSQWRSTRESAAAVMALVEYMTAMEEDVRLQTEVVVEVNGRQAARGHVGGSGSSAAASLLVEVAPGLLVPGENCIDVLAKGGPAYYSVTASWYEARGHMEASGECADIAREYFIIDRNAEAPKGEEYALIPIDEEDSVSPEQELLVRVTIDAKSDMEYMIFEDPIPSGFEITEDFTDPWSWRYWYDRREARDNRMVFFATWIRAGQQRVFDYILRPERQGRYMVMPTRAWSMYYPELNAHGASRVIEVVDEQ